MDSIIINTLVLGGAKVGAVKRTLCDIKLLPYNECLRMVLDIGAQIEALKENGYGIFHLTSKDIVQTIDGSFMISNKENILQCDEHGIMPVPHAFKFIEGMAPELNSKPMTISYTAAYFSLRSIACGDLKRLYPTKLYFLLERCSHDDPTKRVFIFI